MIKHIVQVKSVNVKDTKTTMNLKKINYIGLWKGAKKRMKFKEFSSWCNDRACDGCWGLTEAIICSNLAEEIYKLPFWNREKKSIILIEKEETFISTIVIIQRRMALQKTLTYVVPVKRNLENGYQKKRYQE